MNAPRSTNRGKVSISVFALVAIVGIAAAVSVLRIGGATAAAPTASPSAAPTAAPPTSPPFVPSQIPTAPPASVPGSVDLDNASGHDVSILIHDETGDVVGAESGTPGDGMSVRWLDSIVENLDASTIRVTWVGLPGDDVSDLAISGDAGGYAITIVQPGPYANTDAMGEDRVLVLTFDAPVSADDVSVEILNRTGGY